MQNNPLQPGDLGPLAKSLQAMIASGLTGDGLVSAISALENAIYTKKKTPSAIRQARYRRNKSVTKRNKSVTELESVTKRNESVTALRSEFDLFNQNPNDINAEAAVTKRNESVTPLRSDRENALGDTYLLTSLLKQERKKVSKEESKQVSKTTGTKFSKTELAADWKKFCAEHRPDLKPEDIFAEFRDYWIAVPGAKGRKLDWDATWRNWVRSRRLNGHASHHARPAEQKPTATWIGRK